MEEEEEEEKKKKKKTAEDLLGKLIALLVMRLKFVSHPFSTFPSTPLPHLSFSLFSHP